MSKHTVESGWVTLYSIFMVVLIATGCSSGGSSSSSGQNNNTQLTGSVQLSGSVVKGPLANALVAVYPLEIDSFGLNLSRSNTAIDSGTTDAKAAIQGLEIPDTTKAPLIIEFLVQSSTVDLMTGAAPKVKVMRTVLTQAMLDGKKKVYATPLTTLAVNAALSKTNTSLDTAGADTTRTLASVQTTFLTNLNDAAANVSSTFGFGMSSSIDIFSTPPLLEDTTDTAEEKQQVAEYRAAVEGFAAIVADISTNTTGADDDSVLDDLADDLADGKIDGVGSSLNNLSAVNAAIAKDPTTITIDTENGTKTLAQIGDVLNDDAVKTTTTSSVGATDINLVIVAAEADPDKDGDGVLNADDDFPSDAAASKDSDGDGKPDSLVANITTTLIEDTDDDNDLVLDINDAFPLDAAASKDSDGDGKPDSLVANITTTLVEDTDDDNDGVLDTADQFPYDSSESVDTDSDGVGDNADAFPNDATETTDTDGDGVGDNADAFPSDSTETLDTDKDGVGDNADAQPTIFDSDHDSDGVWTFTELTLNTDPTSSLSKPGNLSLIGHTDSTGVALTNAVIDAGGENDTGPTGLSTPQGMSVDMTGQRLFVADQDNARVLVFSLNANGSLASRKAVAVIGQKDFEHNETNGAAGATVDGLDVPESADFFDDGTKQWLMVADDVDDRVVIYDITSGITNGMSASIVLGQSTFTTSSGALTQTGMSSPRSAKVHQIGTKTLLAVADKLNDRVLIWDVSSGIGNLTNGQGADFVLGQINFISNATGVTASSLDGPISTAVWGNVLFVSSEFEDRIVGYDLGIDAVNLANGMAATYVVGNSSFTANTALVASQTNINGPGFIDVSGNYLFAADWSNNRTLVYDLNNFVSGVNNTAVYTFGQTSFTSGTSATAQNRMSAPWGIAVAGNYLYVSEESSDRVISFDISTLAADIVATTYGPNAVDAIGQNSWNPGVVDGTETVVWDAFGSNNTGATGLQKPMDIALGTVLGTNYLFVAEDLNERVTVYEADSNFIPVDMQADFVIGQPNFDVDSNNTTASGLDSPKGVAFDQSSGLLFVSQSGLNDRVSVFDLSAGISNGMAASAVLGQTTFTSATSGIAINKLNTPNKMVIGTLKATNERLLFIADNLNDRVMIFDITGGVSTGQFATYVLGQADFTTNSALEGQAELGSPKGIDFDADSQRLFVADGTRNKVYVWDLSSGITNGMLAAHVLGQSAFTSTIAGNGAGNFNEVTDIGFDSTRNTLWAVDSLNNRVLGFDLSKGITNGMDAVTVLGQPSLTSTTAYVGAQRNTFTLQRPVGIAVGSTGTLYLTSELDSRVTIWK